MAGAGKTSSVHAFLRWLDETGGLQESAFWFDFRGILSAEYVLDTLTEGLFGTNAMALPLSKKLDVLEKTLKAHRRLIVWDNFESAADLSDADRQILKDFLHRLRGGRTKVLITSRADEAWSSADEAWLTKQECRRIPLGSF
jgi:hypothetical protein